VTTAASCSSSVRDAAGIVQVVVDPDTADGADPHQLRAEYVIRADGVVRHRPEGTVNTELATGEIEVAATRLEVLNPAEPSPIPLERVEADEALRLKFRYLDLRRDRMQRNLRLRAVVNDSMRRSMIGQAVRGDRDAGAHRVDPGRRAATSWCRLGFSPVRSTPAAEPAAVQAAC